MTIVTVGNIDNNTEETQTACYYVAGDYRHFPLKDEFGLGCDSFLL